MVPGITLLLIINWSELMPLRNELDMQSMIYVASVSLLSSRVHLACGAGLFRSRKVFSSTQSRRERWNQVFKCFCYLLRLQVVQCREIINSAGNVIE